MITTLQLEETEEVLIAQQLYMSSCFFCFFFCVSTYINQTIKPNLTKPNLTQTYFKGFEMSKSFVRTRTRLVAYSATQCCICLLTDQFHTFYLFWFSRIVDPSAQIRQYKVFLGKMFINAQL